MSTDEGMKTAKDGPNLLTERKKITMRWSTFSERNGEMEVKVPAPIVAVAARLQDLKA